MSSASGGRPKKPAGGKKNSLEEKIQLHLTDKNDHITDEDIRNVVVGDGSSEPGPSINDVSTEDFPKDPLSKEPA